MTLKFASKPNVNGHRMFLTVDTVNKVAEISHRSMMMLYSIYHIFTMMWKNAHITQN